MENNILTESDIANTNLASKGVLVRLSIKKWSGVKTSKKVAEQIAVDHDVPVTRIRGVLEVLGREAVILTRNPCNHAHTFLNLHTSPFDDLGWRFLPSDKITEVKERMEKFKEDFLGGVTEILDGYDSFKEKSKLELGDLFEEDFFPSKEDLEEKFSWEGNPFLITTIEDATQIIGLQKSLENYDHLSDQVLEEIQEGILKKHENAIRLIDQDTKNKLMNQLDNFITNVEGFNPNKKDARKGNTLRKNTLDNLVKEAESIRQNITGNPSNDAIADAVSNVIRMVGDYESFKADTGEAKKTRKRALNEAKKVKKDITKDGSGSLLDEMLGGDQ